MLVPVLILDPLPGESLKFFASPRAAVVLFLDAFVFVHGEQDKGLLVPGIHDAQRGRVGVFQGLYLLFGQFDYGCLLSEMLSFPW